MPEVTDPALIAELEKTQTQIDKGGEKDAPYSQSALDAFDRAIDSAKRLKEHPGFITSVGMPSINPMDGNLAGFTVPGSNAADFRAELDALKAQVFLPMVQSMKGMGALSNAEGQKLTDALGALDTGMSEAGFAQSLDRIITDLETYRNRGAPQVAPDAAKLAGAGATTTLEGAPPELQKEVSAYLSSIKPGTLTPEAYAGYVEALRLKYNWAKDSLPYTADFVKPFVDQFNKAGKAGPVQPFKRPLSTGEQMLNDAGSSVLGAGVIGAADAITGGFMPEIAGMVGGDESSIDAGIQQTRDASPVASFIGNMVGGAMLPIGRGAGAARLAGEAAAYGAYSGAGNAEGGFTDRLDEAAIGAGAGGALGFLGGKLADRISARMNGGPPPPSGSAQRVADAKDFGIDLSIGDAGGRGSKIIERTLDALPGSAAVMEKARGQLRSQVDGAVETLADRAGSASGNAGTGRAVQSGVKNAMTRADREAERLYGEIKIPDGFRANMGNTMQALEGLTQRFSSNPQFAESRVNQGFVRDLQAIKNGGLTWAEMKAWRSEVGEAVGEAIIGEKSSRADLRKLYAALSSDMRATAMDRGPDALAAFERANKYFAGKEHRLENVYKQFIGKDFDANPEAAANRLRAIISDGKATASIRDLAQLRGGMKADEWSEAQSGLIRLMGQPAKSEGRNFDPAVFVRSYGDMTDKAKNILFGGQKRELRQELDKFAAVMGDLAETGATRNTSNTGLVAGGVATLATGLSNPLALLASVGGQYLTAKAWTNPAFINWATGFSKMLKGAARAGQAPQISRQMEYLGRVAKSQPVIAQDILGLRTALENAFGQAAASTPARLAAAPEQNKKEGQK